MARRYTSKQIRRLEDKVGHPLFNRDAGGVTLTAVGREFLPVARRALAELADGLALARAVGSGLAGRVRIGFAASVAPAGIRRLRLRGVAFRRIAGVRARTRVAVGWRTGEDDPVVARVLAGLGS
ncbi:LysR family transcriptional regulator [Nonomuraea sp. NBC_01738]|uniref:LysR family transcriptional regulator n=1 Tax=Nonomuraea sp. NBC_01738 TaxID=2976003 RepID=UPI002E14439B|nr:LysR family transcriptional regulator [Nonomuraea sp. NBC_01738]